MRAGVSGEVDKALGPQGPGTGEWLSEQPQPWCLWLCCLALASPSYCSCHRGLVWFCGHPSNGTYEGLHLKGGCAKLGSCEWVPGWRVFVPTP